MKGVCHASYSTVRIFLRDVVGVTISRGELSNILGKVSEAAGEAYEELLLLLPDEDILNVDETGHRCNKEPLVDLVFPCRVVNLLSHRCPP